MGSIIISPTRELAGQLFDVLKTVGKRHNFSAGLLIGGRKDIDTEKEHVNRLNILVCTPGRLLQHMDETPNFECSLLQVTIIFSSSSFFSCFGDSLLCFFFFFSCCFSYVISHTKLIAL